MPKILERVGEQSESESYRNVIKDMNRMLREPLPRQVDKKSRGPQGERCLEYSRRKNGQTFYLFPPIFLRII